MPLGVSALLPQPGVAVLQELPDPPVERPTGNRGRLWEAGPVGRCKPVKMAAVP